MSKRTPIFAANWKMNKLVAETGEFVSRFKGLLADVPGTAGRDFEVVIAPPATHLTTLAREAKGTPLEVSGQNCGTAKWGAFTGEISPAVLKEVGCTHVIVGHSERRHVYKEDDALVAARAKAALDEGLKVIFCVGEVLAERKENKTFQRIETQLSVLLDKAFANGWSRLVIAYEPVWAIGTGENATPQQAQEVHAFIRRWVADRGFANEAGALRILYGGSVKPENAGQIMAQADVDGLLVGGASLDPTAFAGIVKNGLISWT